MIEITTESDREIMRISNIRRVLNYSLHYYTVTVLSAVLYAHANAIDVSNYINVGYLSRTFRDLLRCPENYIDDLSQAEAYCLFKVRYTAIDFHNFYHNVWSYRTGI